MKSHLCLLLVAVVYLACSSGPSPNPNPQPPDPTPPIDNTPIAPSNLKATSVTVDAVELQWKDNSSNEIAFRVFRDNVQLATTERNSYADKTVEQDKKYRYYVEAFNDYGKKSSNTITVSTPSAPTVPLKPANVAAERDFHQLVLSWQDKANNENNYIVKRSDLPGVTLPKNSISYVDKNLDLNKKYSYEIYAVNSTGESEHATIEATTRGFFQVRWNRALDRKEVGGQLVENGYATKYVLNVQQADSSFVAYAGPDTSCALIMEGPFCTRVYALDAAENKGQESEDVCSE